MIGVVDSGEPSLLPCLARTLQPWCLGSRGYGRSVLVDMDPRGEAFRQLLKAMLPCARKS
jgi:hypothetical protein